MEAKGEEKWKQKEKSKWNADVFTMSFVSGLCFFFFVFFFVFQLIGWATRVFQFDCGLPGIVRLVVCTWNVVVSGDLNFS